MDNKIKTETLNVKASDIHGPSVSLRVLFLFGAFCFVMGFFIGGITLPYLRFKPPIEDLKNQDKNPTHDGALTTIGPQTLWAAPMEGIAPISTNLSVEQVIDEYRNRGERNGYETNIEYANVGEGFEALIATELLIKIQSGLGPFFDKFSDNTSMTLFGVLVFLSVIFTINKFIWLPLLHRSHKLLES